MLRTWTAFGEIGAANWDDLLGRSSCASIFQTHWWLTAWWETFKRPSWELRLIGSLVDDRLMAIVPMYLDRDRRRAFFVGLPHGDYATVIADRTNPEAAAGVIRELLRWSRSGVIIELAQLPGRAELRRQILELAGNRFAIARYQDLVCPYFPITEETVDAVRQKKSARRHAAALRRLGDLAVHHLLTTADIVPWLEAFFEQHVERWSSTPFPSLFVDASDREFYSRLARSPEAEGRIIFTVILLNGEPAAFHFGFGFAETYYWYKPAFDPKLARSSPGEFLLSELVTMAHTPWVHDIRLRPRRRAVQTAVRL